MVDGNPQKAKMYHVVRSEQNKTQDDSMDGEFFCMGFNKETIYIQQIQNEED